MKLDERTARLIAVGASVSANCRACLEHNAARALASGAGEQDVAEAIRVGRLVRQGAAAMLDAYAAGLHQAAPDSAGASAAGCACE